jgi:cell division protein FtsA
MAAFVVADPVFMEDVQARLTTLGLQIKGYLSPSLGEALMLIPPEERDKMALLVDSGYLSTEVMIVEGDALIYHKVLPIGGGHITADLAYGLSISMDMAEQVKRRYAFGSGNNQPVPVTAPGGKQLDIPRDQIAQVLEPRAEEIVEMVARAVREAPIGLNSRSMYYITGGGLAMMRGGREYVSSILERQVKAPLPLTAKLNMPCYSSSLGLLELVYESLGQQEEVSQAKKTGGFFKAFFTK